MAIPFSYTLRSLRARWRSAVISALGIAGTVSVFLVVLSLARGLKAVLVSTGSPVDAIIMRAGATLELMSNLKLNDIQVIETMPGVAHSGAEPLISAERVMVTPFVLKSTGISTGVQIRGVSRKAFLVRDNLKIEEGALFTAGLNELVVGRNVVRMYEGFGIGQKVRFGGSTWTVVGVLDGHGGAFDSDIWCDANVLSGVYKDQADVFQSATVRLTSPAAFAEFKDALTSDPRLNIQVEREQQYYEDQSYQFTTVIAFLGGIVATVMGAGAIVGAINTMYSAVAERSGEIAVIRALGFETSAVAICFVFESVCIAVLGWSLGCIAILPLNGLTTATMNSHTFSQIAFGLQIDAPLILMGLTFACLMGILGGLSPALRASRTSIAVMLRDL